MPYFLDPILKFLLYWIVLAPTRRPASLETSEKGSQTYLQACSIQVWRISRNVFKELEPYMKRGLRYDVFHHRWMYVVISNLIGTCFQNIQ